jgi:hypothetical protein
MLEPEVELQLFLVRMMQQLEIRRKEDLYQLIPQELMSM